MNKKIRFWTKSTEKKGAGSSHFCSKKHTVNLNFTRCRLGRAREEGGMTLFLREGSSKEEKGDGLSARDKTRRQVGWTDEVTKKGKAKPKHTRTCSEEDGGEKKGSRGKRKKSLNAPGVTTGGLNIYSLFRICKETLRTKQICWSPPIGPYQRVGRKLWEGKCGRLPMGNAGRALHLIHSTTDKHRDEGMNRLTASKKWAAKK